VENDLQNKTIVVTGATSGIGLAAAELLAKHGAAVIGVGRSPERCRAAEARLRAFSTARVDYLTADLSLQRDVRALAAGIAACLGERGVNHLDGLLNNAGAFTYWFKLTPEGVETQWALNHLAPFLLTRLLLPLLEQAPAARVVTVSSGSHYGARLNMIDPQLRRRYNGLKAYGNTKLANVLFTAELNRRLGAGSSVRALAADPGLVKTEIGFKGTPALVRWVWKLRASGGISAEESARGIVALFIRPEVAQSTEIYWKHGKPKPASQAAYDAETARLLWAYSEQMCGLDRMAQNGN